MLRRIFFLPVCCACALLAACAVGERGLPIPDGSVPRDLGAFIESDMNLAADLSTPIVPPDFAGVDLAGVDLSGIDLAGVCTSTPRINEVQTDGAGGASDEWVELYNPCGQPFPLAGWKLMYRSATNSTATDTSTVGMLSGSIDANGYYLVANTNYSGAATADIKPFSGGGGLLLTGGAVGLRDPSGTLVDGVGWGNANNPFVETSAAIAPASRRSIARHPNGADTNNNANDFTDSTPSPRASN